ncbi:MAG: spore protease YyaC [Clostridia bacterium]|nr:spore protease YyaC [Clostridia bacterium]
MDFLQLSRARSQAQVDFPEKVRCHYQDPLVESKLAQSFCQFLYQYQVSPCEPIVIVGIGTDRSTGDSLGPLVGTKLNTFAKKSFHIYGTLDEPVHATNLNAKLEEIHANHKDAFVIAIDACLGRLENVGMITLASGSVKPGAGVQKNLPEVGRIHFTGTVNVGGCMEFMVLQNTRLSVVMKIAQNIANIIFYGYHKFLISSQQETALTK